MTDTDERVRVPEVLDNEDGDMWFIVGHVTEVEARLALLWQMLNDGLLVDDRADAYAIARDVKITRRCAKPDPTDEYDERFIDCAEDDPDAVLFTVMVNPDA